ncbi:MAG: flagellar export chaperone FlgN [Bdellovibrionales bacterium]|nr:flagellar export chaperone FlgN [Bdellovibrionales bacterium]
MDSKLQTLTLILDRMDVLYGRVMGLLSRERSALIAMDFDGLLMEMREKDEIISALRALDKDRLRIQDQFAILMGKAPEEVSLRTLAEALIEQGASAREVGMRLMDQRERLGRTVDQLREKITSNSTFIERSIENLQGIAAHYTAAVQGRANKAGGKGPGTYNGKAKYQQVPGVTGSLVEKRL